MTYPTIMPALTLDFQNSQQLDPRVTFSRASSATYINSAGLVASAADHEARFDHDGNGECLGLLLEESRTNHCLYSGVDPTNWAQNGTSSLAVSSVPAPDGGTCYDLTTDTGGPNSVRQQSNTSAPVGTSVLSVFARFPNAGFTSLAIRNFSAGGGANYYADYRPATDSWHGEVACTGLPSEDLGNGWKRLTVVSTVTSSNGNNWVNIGGGANSPAFTQQTCQIWGAQLEEGEFQSSYIPTSTSAVTRSQDIAQVTTADIYGDEFTIINKPFGVSSGGSTLHLQGHPHVERAAVYNEYLSQEQINTVAEVDEFWRWRILGSSFALSSFQTDGQVTVDWGDGTVETLTTGQHTFTNGGGYHDIGFRLDSGTYFLPNLDNNATHKYKVIAVGPGPESMKVDLAKMVQGASNLVSIDSTISLMSASNRKLRESICLDCTSLKSFPYIDFSGASLSSIRHAWKNCTSMESFPLLDLSQASNLGDAGGRGTWNNCSSLKSFPAIDFPNVTIATNAWQNCSSMTEFNATGFGLCTSFPATWNNCSSMTNFPLIDTSSATNFGSAWTNCSSLTSFPLIDTSSGTNFGSTWQNCSSLTSFPLIDTSSGTSFQNTWKNCTSLTSFPLIDTSSGTNFNFTWIYCPLTSFPAIDTSSGTSFYGTWRATGIVSFPLLDVSSSGYFNQAWLDCTSLVDFPANFFDNMATPSSSAFLNSWRGCSSLSATSVENILNSVDTSGHSAPSSSVEITIVYDTGTGTPNITTAVTNLKSRGWTIRLNNVFQ